MGATGVAQVVKGETAAKAYNKAVDEARWEHGSGGYTGTIAESRGFDVAKTGPLLEWEASRVADAMQHDGRAEKWGPSILIPLAEAGATRTFKMKVDMAGVLWNNESKVILEAIRARLKPGEGIESVHQVMDVKRKIVKVRSSGPTKTVYRVAKRGSGTLSLHPTMAAATAWAEERLNSVHEYGDELQITKMTLREDGSPLVTLRREEVSRAAVLTVTAAKVKGPRRGEWLAVGVYSC